MSDLMPQPPDVAGDVRRRAICKLCLRGFLPHQIVACLGVAEQIVRNDIAALERDWTWRYGSIDIGECVTTFRVIREISNQIGDQPALSVNERSGFVRLALLAGYRVDLHLSTSGSLTVRPPLDANGIRERIAAVKRALARERLAQQSQRPEAMSAGSPDLERADRLKSVERCLGVDLSEIDIATRLRTSPSYIRDDLEKIRARWSEAYGTIEAGQALARYRVRAEQMLDAAMQPGVSSVDRQRCLRTVLLARDSQLALLAHLGHVEAARKATCATEPTQAELEEIKARFDAPLWTREEAELICTSEEEMDRLLEIKQRSIWE
jgi:hypothetical protein